MSMLHSGKCSHVITVDTGTFSFSSATTDMRLVEAISWACILLAAHQQISCETIDQMSFKL